MAAPLANTDEARLTDVFKEVQLLYTYVSQAIAAKNAPIDSCRALVWNPMELSSVNPDALAFCEVILLELAHLN